MCSKNYNSCEPPMKRIKSDELNALDGLFYEHKQKLEGKNKCRGMNNIQEMITKHGLDFNSSYIAYEKVGSFFEDFSSGWNGGLSQSKIELFELNDLLKVMNHHSVRQYFKHNLEKYCHLLSFAMEKLSNINLLLVFLHNDTIFHKTLIFEKEFQKYFLNINLPIIINLLQIHDDLRLFREVCEVFNKVIFHRNHVEFEKYLDKVIGISEDELKETFCLPKALLKATAASYKLENLKPNIIHKVIMQTLFNSCKEFSLIYKFVIVLIELLGFNLSKDFECRNIAKYTGSNELSKSLSILSDMLEVISNNKSELSCSVKICFSQFVENIVNSVLGLTNSPNETCYKILRFSIEIHPLLVEKNLNNLLAYSVVSNEVKSDEYCTFLLKIFETYDKLHRIQNLISKMLPILKSSIGDNRNYEVYYLFRGKEEWHKEMKNYFDVQKVIPEVVLNYFSQCVVQMASWQVMNLFKTFSFHLEATVTNFLESSDDNQNIFLQLLCRFSSWLLRSIRMSENTATKTVLENFNSAMGVFKNILSKLGEALLKQEHDEDLVEAFLNLSHDWAEMYMIFHFYTRSYMQDDEIFCNVNHPNYLHSFLTSKHWILLSQRITNFGESNCRHLMLKILVQKLRAMHIFGQESDGNIQREVLLHMSSDINSDCKYITSEKFIHENLLDLMNSDIVLNLAEQILNALDSKTISIDFRNSKILSLALTYTILSKIAKILKSKSKYLFVRIISNIDKELFFGQNDDDISINTFKSIYEQNLWENEKYLQEECMEKIEQYMIQLKLLPLPYLSPKIHSIILISFFALHKNCSKGKLMELLEETIIGLLQTIKLDLMEIFDPFSLMKHITLNFERKYVIISLISENVIKNEDSLKCFTPGITFLLENMDICDNLQHSVVILRDLQKVKKSKVSKEFKDTCKEIIDVILEKHFEVVREKEAGIDLILSYVSCLKHFLSQENDNLAILLKKMNDYLRVTMECETNTLPNGSTALLKTVLHHKQILKMSSDLPVKIWKYCKMKDVRQNDIQDFSQLLCLVFENIPNENFGDVCQDLFAIAEDSIQTKNFGQLSKHLTTWSYILTSYFNPIKFKLWQQVLEKLLIKLSILKNQTTFNEKLSDEIMQFEIAIIQHNQLLISPTMMGIFLMSPVFLLQKDEADFYYKFHKCADYLASLLKHRNSLIMDRLPPFLKVFRILLGTLCNTCSTNTNENSLSELDKLADCAHQLEKLVRQLVLFKKHIARIAPHLIADILQQYERTTLYPKVRIHLNNCIYSLVSLCDQHAVSYLLRVLSSASTELFKIMFDNYKKFYRFTGKV